ncbi:hypothetical protein OIV40_31420, partial [Burkholderia pseudomallei]|uniref:hypothetical protein n=1 Tax=Burkholderia pseudomallei TaxID=28450 RepID=UPI0021F7DFC4
MKRGGREGKAGEEGKVAGGNACQKAEQKEGKRGRGQGKPLECPGEEEGRKGKKARQQFEPILMQNEEKRLREGRLREHEIRRIGKNDAAV